MKIAIVGDTHMHFKVLTHIYRNHLPDMIFQCGDFGYWPNNPNYDLSAFDSVGCNLHFCDGNHEHHELLRSLKSTSIYKNVFYQPRGSILKLCNKQTVLFMGGAASVDIDSRVPGYDWFYNETISSSDVYNIPNDTKIDIVISHTCPNEFIPEKYMITDKKNDISRTALSYILNTYKPTLWYFGHWHVSNTGFDKGCRWYALNRSDDCSDGSLQWLTI